MLRLKFILIFVFGSCLLFAQSEEASISDKFQYIVNINPKYAIIGTSYGGLGIRNDKFGYSAGLGMSFKISDRFRFRTGLNIEQIRLSYTDFDPFFDCDGPEPSWNDDWTANMNQTASIIWASNSTIEDELELTYLTIPIGLVANITSGQNQFYFLIGGEVGYLIAENYLETINECGNYEMREEDHFREVQQLLFKAELGIGFEFEISKKIRMYVQPGIERTWSYTNPNYELPEAMWNSRDLFSNNLSFEVGIKF